MNVRCCCEWHGERNKKCELLLMLLLIVAMMTSQKKNEKSRIEYDINGRKFEFWMKKITALMTCLLGVSMFVSIATINND